jgi:oxalate decarboxylase/phosphoglucose isomerase-like protein (cupin superfamily)
MKLAFAIAAVLLVGTAQAQLNASLPLTTQYAQRQQFPPNAFVYTLALPSKVGANTSAATSFDRRIDTDVFLATLPNRGMSQTFAELKACGVLLPHVHPRATEIYFVINGTIETSIIQEYPAKALTFSLTSNQDAVVPQGLGHSLYNPTCQSAFYVSTFDSSDPGSLFLAQQLFTLPNDVLLASTGQTQDGLNGFNATIPVGSPYTVSASCLQRCGMPMPTATSG